MSSMWGERIKLSVFGGSHTEAIGVTLDGLPAGEKMDWDEILVQMARRAPGQDPSATRRVEKDEPHVVCGMSSDGVLTGAPLCALIYNSDQHSKDYGNLKVTPRPGHADYAAFVKYQGNNDIRGGGHFSGRLTAPLVFAGAVCRQILSRHGILIGGHVLSVGPAEDRRFNMADIEPEILKSLSREYFPVLFPSIRQEMRRQIEEARLALDRLGGVVECAVTGLPTGMGNPMFGGVENLISSIVFGVPAVKGIEFGAGFQAARKMGHENNDSFYYDDGGAVKTRTNNAGGILGGITTGMPLVFRAAVKPTPSISREQDTVNLETGENVKLVIKGRHDPCIVPRAVPALESAAAVAVLELLAQNGKL